ncbi:MAG: imidazole glycerol phosphate synthase subunit HisH [Oscillospiraceae bacterium]|jgi:glutamine amidotransferase|nr:imidazole glycerol phosphate synthase subunit HisH [Oscillospiraceae bacterium]
MIAIVDYGMGNLFSLKNALDSIGADSEVTSNAEQIAKADKVILPGVGAFPAAMKRLVDSKLAFVLQAEAKRKPLLGICLGMQLLFDSSDEVEQTAGLSLLRGHVKLMTPSGGLDVPHMGWNSLVKGARSSLTDSFSEGDFVYFVHSFLADTDDEYISAYAEYGGRVPAIVTDGAYVTGTQFHPEKSGETGLTMLKHWCF